MKVLVTNDDGVGAPGLAALARAVEAAGHETVVVAPDADWSGASAAVGNFGDHERIEFHRARIDGFDGEVWAAVGPPARGVLAVLRGGFGWMPDAIASGVNPGCNLGRSVIHSGTVGAVLAGANHDIPGVALSTRVAEHVEAAAAYVAPALSWLEAQARPVVLNINVPDLDASVAGVSSARLGPRGLNNVASETATDDPDVRHIELRRSPFEPDAVTDYGLIGSGHVTVTVLEPVRGTEADAGLLTTLRGVGR